MRGLGYSSPYVFMRHHKCVGSGKARGLAEAILGPLAGCLYRTLKTDFGE